MTINSLFLIARLNTSERPPSSSLVSFGSEIMKIIKMNQGDVFLGYSNLTKMYHFMVHRDNRYKLEAYQEGKLIPFGKDDIVYYLDTYGIITRKHIRVDNDQLKSTVNMLSTDVLNKHRAIKAYMHDLRIGTESTG